MIKILVSNHGIQSILQEEFEDAKGVIRIRISKKNRHNNDQKKKYKRTNNDLQKTRHELQLKLFVVRPLRFPY